MKSQFSSIALALVVATGIAGCGGGGGGDPAPSVAGPVQQTPPTPPPEPAPAPVSYTTYSKQMHAASEEGEPWEIDGITFTFDGDDNPAAYEDFMPAES